MSYKTGFHENTDSSPLSAYIQRYSIPVPCMTAIQAEANIFLACSVGVGGIYCTWHPDNSNLTKTSSSIGAFLPCPSFSMQCSVNFPSSGSCHEAFIASTGRILESAHLLQQQQRSIWRRRRKQGEQSLMHKPPRKSAPFLTS